MTGSLKTGDFELSHLRWLMTEAITGTSVAWTEKTGNQSGAWKPELLRWLLVLTLAGAFAETSVKAMTPLGCLWQDLLGSHG